MTSSESGPHPFLQMRMGKLSDSKSEKKNIDISGLWPRMLDVLVEAEGPATMVAIL